MVAEQNGTFSTIITFPNFLLHVLRLMTEKDVPLDDKRLLESFNEFMIGEYDDPEWFIVSLLQARILFDRYIIKRENDEDWSLKTLKRYLNEQNNFNYVNSSKNDKLNKQLTMLLAMLHVSFPAQVYKHWLNAALYYLVSCWDEEEKLMIPVIWSFLKISATVSFLAAMASRALVIRSISMKSFTRRRWFPQNWILRC